MNKAKMTLITTMLSLLVITLFAEKQHGFTNVGNLYAYNGTSYSALTEDGVFDEGFTTTNTGFPSTITDASGTPCPLYTLYGGTYYVLYSTNSW
jgi:hypothetical protein